MNNIPPKITDSSPKQKLNTPPKIGELKKLKNIGIFLKYLLILSMVAFFCLTILCTLLLWSNYNSVYCENCYAFHGGEFNFKNNNGKICDNCDKKMESIFFNKEVIGEKICLHCSIVVHNKNDIRKEITYSNEASDRNNKGVSYIHKTCNTATFGIPNQILPVIFLIFSLLMEVVCVYLLLRFLKVQRLKKLSNAVNE
jgi:hypothetical protein